MSCSSTGLIALGFELLTFATRLKRLLGKQRLIAAVSEKGFSVLKGSASEPGLLRTPWNAASLEANLRNSLLQDLHTTQTD